MSDTPSKSSTQRQVRVAELLRELAATFLARESNRTSLITVTYCDVAPNMRRATIFFTVLPVEKEKDAAAFVTRQLGAFREYAMKKTRMKMLPFFDAKIDSGEKMRQKIDELGLST